MDLAQLALFFCDMLNVQRAVLYIQYRTVVLTAMHAAARARAHVTRDVCSVGAGALAVRMGWNVSLGFGVFRVWSSFWGEAG